MPLVTKITRNGKVLKVPWDDHTLNCFLSVGLQEGDYSLWAKCLKGTPRKDLHHEIDGVKYEKPMNFMMIPVYYLTTKAPLWTEGIHIVKREHIFAHHTKPLIFSPGDVLEMHRESSLGL